MSDLEIKCKAISEGKILFMLCDGPVVYSEIGVWSFTKERNVLFGLRNFSANASDFFNFVIDVTKKYDNLYAVPNKQGRQVWSALKWNNKNLKICIADKKSIVEKIRLRICFRKFFFMNIFFVLKPTDRKSLIMNRKLFYKGNLPRIVLVDTF
jgi:hypothetical protein